MFIRAFENRKNQALERLTRLDNLDDEQLNLRTAPGTTKSFSQNSFNKKGLSLLLYQADSKISVATFLIYSLLSGILLTLFFSKLFTIYFIPVFFILGCLIPLAYQERQIKNRVANFAEDYAELLLAMSSSIKVGMTADRALERSIDLFPEKSLVKLEVRKLLDNLSDGTSKEVAINHFARSIRLPELDLFRSAYLLVLENGGKFSPTLKRLAEVTKDRLTLILSAQVSTATMRMTANFLLFFLPIILLLLSSRTKNYWQLLLHHPQINFFASIGLSMILLGYFVLLKMSDFKP